MKRILPLVFIVCITLVSHGQDEARTPELEEVENFCAAVEGTFKSAVTEFNFMVTGKRSTNPTDEQVEAFWNLNRETLICPDDGLSDETHFLGHAAETMNLEFISVLAENYKLDMNFSFYDGTADKNATVMDCLLFKLDKVTKNHNVVHGLPTSNAGIHNPFVENIEALNVLMAWLRENGALYYAELKAR